MRNCLLLFFSFYSIIVVGQYLELERMPNINETTIAWLKISPDQSIFLWSNGGNSDLSFYNSGSNEWQTISLFGTVDFFSNGLVIGYDMENESIVKLGSGEFTEIFNLNGDDEEGDKVVERLGRFKIKDDILYVFYDNSIYVSTDFGLSFEKHPLYESDFQLDSHIIEITDDYIFHFVYLWDRAGSFMYVYDKALTLLKEVNLYGRNNKFNVLSNNAIIYDDIRNIYYLEDYNSEPLDITSYGYYNRQVFNDHLYFQNTDSISKIEIDDLFGAQSLIQDGIEDFSRFESTDNLLYFYTDSKLFQIDSNDNIIEIQLNHTSSELGQFYILNQGIYCESNGNIFSLFDDGEWNKLDNPHDEKIQVFAIHNSGQIFSVAGVNNATISHYYSDNFGQSFNVLQEAYGVPYIFGQDTLIGATGFCSDIPSPLSILSTDAGQTWREIGLNACNGPQNYSRINNNIYFHDNTYTYGGVPVPGVDPTMRLYLKLDLDNMGGTEILLPDYVPYPIGSTLIKDDGKIYLHPLPSPFNPADSINLPAYIGRVDETELTELGPSPRGKVFEGPESESIFLVNNEDLHSKLYYRETPTSEYEEVQLSQPELGKIKYIKYDDVGQLYIATELSHFYKADLLASSTDEIEITKVKLFPNPSSDYIHIDMDEVPRTIELFDIQGKKVNAVFNSLNLDLSHLENGIYILKISFGDGQIFTDKVVKVGY